MNGVAKEVKSWLWLLSGVVLLAWLPALQSYYHNGDEYLYLEMWDRGFRQTLQDHLANKGLQRIIAYAWAVPLAAAPVWLTGIICVMVHLLAVLLFFLTAKTVTRHVVLAFVLAAAWGVFPTGYYALMWSPGTYAILHFSFVLVAFGVLLRQEVRPYRKLWQPLTLSAVAMLLAGFTGEYLIFALPLIGLLAACTAGGQHASDWRLLIRKPVVWWPVMVTLCILALIALSKPHGLGSVEKPVIGDLNWQKINPRSLFSVWFHQLDAFLMLQPWTRAGAWREVFQTWTPLMLITAVILGVTLWRELGAKFRSSADTGMDGKPGLALGGVLILFLPAVSSVHVLAGGYKGDSRHNYIPSAFALLLFGWVAARFLSRASLGKALSNSGIKVMLLVFIVTTWLVLGVFRFESRRHHAVIQFAQKTHLSGPIRLVYDPTLYDSFPSMSRTMSHGFEDGWCLDWALSYLRHSGVHAGHPPQLMLSRDSQAPAMTVTGRGPAFELSISGTVQGASALNP